MSLATRPTGNARTTIRAIVTTNSACSVTANIETFDTATGVTHIHVEGGVNDWHFSKLVNFVDRTVEISTLAD